MKEIFADAVPKEEQRTANICFVRRISNLHLQRAVLARTLTNIYTSPTKINFIADDEIKKHTKNYSLLNIDGGIIANNRGDLNAALTLSDMLYEIFPRFKNAGISFFVKVACLLIHITLHVS